MLPLGELSKRETIHDDHSPARRGYGVAHGTGDALVPIAATVH
jgi:hypothetical protein